MAPAERAINACDDIRDLLSGPLDACALALDRGDVAAAEHHLREGMERLRRIRRNLREG